MHITHKIPEGDLSSVLSEVSAVCGEKHLCRLGVSRLGGGKQSENEWILWKTESQTATHSVQALYSAYAKTEKSRFLPLAWYSHWVTPIRTRKSTDLDHGLRIKKKREHLHETEDVSYEPSLGKSATLTIALVPVDAHCQFVRESRIHFAIQTHVDENSYAHLVLTSSSLLQLSHARSRSFVRRFWR